MDMDCFPDSSLITVGRYGKWLTDKSAAHTDSPDGGTGKTCLGGDMHCRSASSFLSTPKSSRSTRPDPGIDGGNIHRLELLTCDR